MPRGSLAPPIPPPARRACPQCQGMAGLAEIGPVGGGESHPLAMCHSVCPLWMVPGTQHRRLRSSAALELLQPSGASLARALTSLSIGWVRVLCQGLAWVCWEPHIPHDLGPVPGAGCLSGAAPIPELCGRVLAASGAGLPLGSKCCPLFYPLAAGGGGRDARWWSWAIA